MGPLAAGTADLGIQTSDQESVSSSLGPVFLSWHHFQAGALHVEARCQLQSRKSRAASRGTP